MKIIIKNADYSECYIKQGYKTFDTTSQEVTSYKNLNQTRVYGWYFGKNIMVKSLELPLVATLMNPVTVKIFVADKTTKYLNFVSEGISLTTSDNNIVFTDEGLAVGSNEVLGIMSVSGSSGGDCVGWTAIKDGVKCVNNIAYVDSLVEEGTLNTTSGTIGLENYSLFGKVIYEEVASE